MPPPAPGGARPATGAKRRAGPHSPAAGVRGLPAVPQETDSPWRQIALKEQVLAQAPAEAAGYRLVLSGRDEWGAPRILPDPTADGAMRFWRLRPFELPDDIRLRDGFVYRLLWVNEQGAHVRPEGDSYLPGLHFFLGPVKPPSEPKAAPDEAWHIANSSSETPELPHEPEPQPQPSEPTTSADGGAELSEQDSLPTGPSGIDNHGGSALEHGGQDAATPAEEKTAQSDSAPREVLGTTVPVGEDGPVDPKSAVAASISQSETSSNNPMPDGVPAQSAMESSGAEPSEMGTAPLAPSTEAATAPSLGPRSDPESKSYVPLCDPPLTHDEISELTRIILHSERFSLFSYEAQCIHARRKGEPPPQAQLLDLGVDEQKRVRRVAQDARLRSATADLLSVWFPLRRAGAEKMLDLPRPFPSVTDAEVSAVAALTSDPERFKYAIYRHARFAALYLEEKLPEHPQTSLTPKERAAVRKLLHDVRLLVMFEEAVRRLASPPSPSTPEDRAGGRGD